MVNGRSLPLFTPYVQMPERVPPRAWTAARWVAWGAAVGIAALAFVDAPAATRLFWGLFVPALPLLLLVAPGLWRNICPLASMNQIPRTLGFTRGLTVPANVQQFTPLVAAGLFVAIVPLRKVFLEQNGVALGTFILALLGLAFVGGLLFKGKSGWCSQVCPMLQVERFYGQAPLAVVRNAHCRPCVGCTTNCYDFNPTAAYLADLHDPNPRLGDNRRLFAAAMPWLIVAFFMEPAIGDGSLADIAAMYGRILLFAAAGIGVFYAVTAVTRLSAQTLAAIHVVAALNLFYFFVTPSVVAQFGLSGAAPAFASGAAIAGVSAVWFLRVLPRERLFHQAASTDSARAAESVVRLHERSTAAMVEVSFDGGPSVLARPGDSLLTIAEANGVPIDSGCRMGMCGSDPVRTIAGDENLSPTTIAERATLARLGLPDGCRLACVARVGGPVTVTTDISSAAPAAPGAPAVEERPAAALGDIRIARVVVVGAGVAGVTAALEARRRLPDAEITLIGYEPYDFYNRLAIGKLVNESIAINKLYLMPQEWPDTHRVRFVRSVGASSLDRGSRSVTTEDGEVIGYDRLILATGARSSVPKLDGFGCEGTFVMRTIDDAVQIQQHIRRHRSRRALIVGGGLLGLEAAYAITQLGVRAIVLDRNEWPLNRQLDRTGGELVRELMAHLNVRILTGVEARRILGDERVTGAELSDGTTVQVDVCLAAAGIEPDIELALSAGLTTRRGIVVDDRLRTSDPHIYAAGDVVEVSGRVVGLWPASLEQGRVAAVNATGGDETYRPTLPPAKLKVAAIDLLSVGEINASPSGAEIAFEDREGSRYRKLVLQDGHVVGAILIGYPELADALSDAVTHRQFVGHAADDLERGDWSSVGRIEAAAA